MTRKLLAKPLCLSALFVLFLAVQPSIATATLLSPDLKQDLLQVQENLQRQEEKYNQVLSLLESSEQKRLEAENKLQRAEEKLVEVEKFSASREKYIAQLESSLLLADSSIEQANQSLQNISDDMKKQVRLAKRQRNLWFAGFICAGSFVLAN